MSREPDDAGGRAVLVTGGSGLLGRALRKFLPDAAYPSSSEFDVTNPSQMNAYVAAGGFAALLHAAAFTSPPKIDADPLRALDVNLIGTGNVVKLCHVHDLRLVYISTDYVFRGDSGRYREEDPVYPVNRYAWSKLGGECAARLYDRALIVRTSFGPDRFPYPKAFEDQWTSRESVSTFARKLAGLVTGHLCGTLHVGGPRRTVLEYARALDSEQEIAPLSIADVSFSVPLDTSLDCGRYDVTVGRTDDREGEE